MYLIYKKKKDNKRLEGVSFYLWHKNVFTVFFLILRVLVTTIDALQRFETG